MAQAVSRRPVTADALVRCQFVSDSVVTQRDTVTGFSRVLLLPPVSIIRPVLHA